jgi:enamine deaminase RidA (YjgF/YER057c/UK114 family)
MTSSNTSHRCDPIPTGIVKTRQPLFGLPQLWMPAGIEVESIESEGTTVHTWSDEHADWCYAQGILPPNPRLRREEQTRGCFERIERIVSQAGFKFDEVARTWFFNHRILEWYGEFNTVRTVFFDEKGIDRMPASTGVGMPNAPGAELTCAVLAIRPRGNGVAVREVFSPEQCPAVDYRSSFSRAMSLDTPERNLLWISGTASIAPCGKTEYVGDVDKQIDRTLEVVEAILHAEKMNWGDVTRAVGYFRTAADAAKFANHARGRELPPQLPIVFAHADICRDDLLFEMEADAVLNR